jgi:hypothetical protein
MFLVGDACIERVIKMGAKCPHTTKKNMMNVAVPGDFFMWWFSQFRGKVYGKD